MDAFSQVLSGIKLNGALFFNAEFSAPWGVASAPAAKLAEVVVGMKSARLVVYHLVVQGVAYAQIGDGEPMAVEAGDVIVFPHGDGHYVTSEAGSKEARQTADVNHKVLARDLSRMQAGGGGETTRFVCGFMACDPHLSKHLLDWLPQMFKVNIRTDPSGRWLENSILYLVEEAASQQPGSDVLLARLSEALFVDTLRRHIAKLPEQQTGWLAGARDPIVGKCLSLMHGRINHPWNLVDLAAEVGLSRSSLMARFSRFLSEPPMTYLMRWRMQTAARALAATPKSVAEISFGVGYESESAFNRAFKRQFGLPPARYRKENRGSA